MYIYLVIEIFSLCKLNLPWGRLIYLLASHMNFSSFYLLNHSWKATNLRDSALFSSLPFCIRYTFKAPILPSLMLVQVLPCMWSPDEIHCVCGASLPVVIFNESLQTLFSALQYFCQCSGRSIKLTSGKFSDLWSIIMMRMKRTE